MDKLAEFRRLDIWQRFNTTNDKNYNFDTMFEDSLSLLDQYYIAFPAYTLHNRQHVKNILEIAGKLLGPKLGDLTCLECVIIILSAVFHDIGMVFNKKDLTSIETEASFQQFLESNLKAKLQFQENNSKLNPDLAQWYCRWMHAQRVWLFLHGLDQNKWKNISLKNAVGHVCESHNQDATTLDKDDLFEINYINEADLRFCAVVLRLCDILDFDNSRSPKSVYEFLDLENPKNSNEKISKDEWNKHLSSNGFIFSHTHSGVEIKFVAGPAHPQIERNINDFLDVIEDELKKCSSVMRKCSSKWRDIRLPQYVDRRDIKSQNYAKGDYSLSLDGNQIIKLLTGENLYENSFVFLRELIQNAMDSSRMREAYEHSIGNLQFKSSSIEINAWSDELGQTWVGVHDFGMGLNEYIVKNHLLKKGNSYYKSDYFKIIKNFIQEKQKINFTPISRFGIGLLSCFMISDKIEISARSLAIPQTNSVEEKIRLSVDGLQGQYIFQSEKAKHEPLPMPGATKKDEKYRSEFGTTVAVRISSQNIHFYLFENIKAIVKQYVLCSPVEIKYNNETIGVDFDTALNTRLCNNGFYPFTSSELSAIENTINKKVTGQFGIEFIALNLSEHTADKNLVGQTVVMKLSDCASHDMNFWTGWEYRFSNYGGHYPQIEFRRKNPEPYNGIDEKSTVINLENIFYKAIQKERIEGIFLIKEREKSYLNPGFILIHNGVTVPNYPESSRRYRDRKLQLRSHLFHNVAISQPEEFLYFGIIYLQDNLIPDLTVARNGIKKIGFNIYSSLYYSMRELNEHCQAVYQFLSDEDYDFSFSEVREDNLIREGIWNQEKLFFSEGSHLSVDEIRHILTARPVRVALAQPHREGTFLTALKTGLLHLEFIFKLKIEDFNVYYLVITKIRDVNLPASPLDKYRPNLFLEFEDTAVLSHAYFVNTSHWIGKWLTSNQEILITLFSGYLDNLLGFIINKRVKEINEVLGHFNNILPVGARPGPTQITEADFMRV